MTIKARKTTPRKQVTITNGVKYVSPMRALVLPLVGRRSFVAFVEVTEVTVALLGT